MNAKNPVVTSDKGFGFSTTSGTDIRGYVISVYRFPVKTNYRLMQKGQIDGLTVATSEEATRLGLEYGYLSRRGRNSSRFVMSRAARKRGYTTGNASYVARAYRQFVESGHTNTASDPIPL